MSTWSTPSASQTALTTAGGAAIAPASPMPLAPSGLCGDGVSVRAASIHGIPEATISG
jgi:hypothetical protein